MYKPACRVLVAIGACLLLASPGFCGWQTFTTGDGLAGTRGATCLLEDRHGNLWFGTLSGVSRYDGATWRTFTTADGLASNAVSCMAEDSSGNLWFGSHGSGVSRYDGETWRTFGVADGLAGNDIWDILEDRSGFVWVAASNGGASRYDGARTWRTASTSSRSKPWHTEMKSLAVVK